MTQKPNHVCTCTYEYTKDRNLTQVYVQAKHKLCIIPLRVFTATEWLWLFLRICKSRTVVVYPLTTAS